MTEGNLGRMTDTTVVDDDEMRARIESQLPGLTPPRLPRRFAICGYDERDEPVVEYWGIEFAGRAVAERLGVSESWRSDSAETMHHTLSIAFDVDLVWLDPPLPSD